MVTVGINAAGGSKAVDIGTANTCPSTVSKANWYGTDTYSDTFSVAQSGSTITVSRADQPGATWGHNLQFYCTFYCCSGVYVASSLISPVSFRDRLTHTHTHTGEMREDAT